MKKVLIGLALLVVLVTVVGLVMPTSYAIEKSVVINAKPEAIHTHVGDLKKWPAWAPWLEMDPTIETTYGPTTTGVGASQTWTSAKDGDGELMLTRSDPTTGIAYEMAFIMEGTRAPSLCAMNYTTEGDTTTVTWTMTGDAGEFMPPVIGGLMTPMMTNEIGSMFEKGLDNLKATVEGK